MEFRPIQIRRLTILLLLIVVLFAGSKLHFTQNVKGPCEITPLEVWYLTRTGAGQLSAGWERNLFTSGGKYIMAQFERPDFVEVTISEDVKDGSFVRKGDTLAIISSNESDIDVEIISAEIEKAKQELIALSSGSRHADIEVAKQALRRTDVELQALQPELNRLKELVSDGHISDSEWDVISGRWDVLSAEREVARANLSALESGGRQEDIDVIAAEIKRLQQVYAGAAAAKEHLQAIQAPLPGKVVFGGLNGEVLKVERVDTVGVFISIPEGLLSRLRENPEAIVNLFAVDLDLQGIKIIRTGFLREGITGGAYAIGLIANPEGKLKVGMRGTATILADELTLFETLKLQIQG